MLRAPTGPVEVDGWLQASEGSGAVDDDPHDDVIPEMRIASIVEHVDADLYSGYVVDREPTDGLVAVPPDSVPEISSSTSLRNLLYALQWWVFGGFAIYIWVRWCRDVVEQSRTGDDRGRAGSVERVTSPDLPRPIRLALLRYRVMANVVGVLLIVLILIGVPLANFDGTPMWGIFSSTPVIWTEGSRAHSVGEWITTVLGIAHGYLYMIFLLMAFLLSRRAKWPMGFTLVTLLLGTVPVAELLGGAPGHRARPS